MLKESLTAWQDWGLNAKPSLIDVFTEGKNHQSGLIESAEIKYVLKLFNHSSDTAIAAQQLAAEQHIAPKVLYQDRHLALMEYLTGGLPSISDTAEALHRLHTYVDDNNRGTSFGTSLNLIQICDKYLADAPDALRTKHTELLPILNEFIDDPTPHCFCHNDLVNENCLSQNNKAIFIDWEYAATNNPWFDLAAIVLYRNLNPKQTTDFLSAYGGWQRKASDRILRISETVVLWCDLLWHTHQYGAHYQEQHAARFKYLDQLKRTLSKY